MNIHRYLAGMPKRPTSCGINYQITFLSWSKRATHTLIILGVCVLALCFSSGCSRHDGTHFPSSTEALAAYRQLLEEVRTRPLRSADELTACCARWHTLRDSVMSALHRDASSDAQDVLAACMATHDSIRSQLLLRVDSLPLSFADVLHLHEALSDTRIRADEQPMVQRFTAFFAGLDDRRVRAVGKSVALHDYDDFLQYYVRRGFTSKDDVLQFIEGEDVQFRTFLTHLPTLGDSPLSGIRSATEQLCRSMFTLVGSEAQSADSLSREEAVVLLTMRSNRRLLQNAEVCLSDVRRGKVTSANASAAYLWMLLQPMVSLDDFALALLSPAQRTALFRVAEQLPSVARQLQRQATVFPLEVSSLPRLLAHTYLLENT